MQIQKPQEKRMGFQKGNSYGGDHGGGRPRRQVTEALFSLFPSAIECYRQVLAGNNMRHKIEVSKDIVRKFAPDLASDTTGEKIAERIDHIIGRVKKEIGQVQPGGSEVDPSGGEQGQS